MIVPAFGFDLGIKSKNLTAQTRENLYMEVKTERDKSSIALFGTPGLLLFNGALAGSNPYRGASQQIGTLWYGVKAGTFYSVNNAGVETSLGTLNTTAGNVSMDYNGLQVMIVDGTNGYLYSTVAGPGTAQSVTSIVNNFPVATVTTGSNHGLTSGNLVKVSGASPAGYNGLHTVTVTGATTFTYNMNANPGGDASPVGTYTQPAFGQITDGNFPNGATTVAWQGGFFLVDNPANNGRFNKSFSYDGSAWAALDFATAESNPDSLVRVFVNQGVVHLLGAVTTEFWSNTGALDFPYALIQGSPVEYGLAARWSVAKLYGSVTFLSANLQGHVQVVTLSGFQPQPISSPELEAEFDTYANVGDAVAFTYEENGHQFYQISFPSAGKTWLYDATMSQIAGSPIWSKLSSNGGRHFAQFYVNFINQSLVTDYASGNVYKLLATTYTDNGIMIRRVVRSKHTFKNNQQISVGRLWVDFETGVGVATGQGSNPQVMMRYSKDGGHTWSSELWVTLGAIGKYLTRAIWQRLGRARDWVFELIITDPVKVVIINAGLRIVEGRE